MMAGPVIFAFTVATNEEGDRKLFAEVAEVSGEHWPRRTWSARLAQEEESIDPLARIWPNWGARVWD